MGLRGIFAHSSSCAKREAWEREVVWNQILRNAGVAKAFSQSVALAMILAAPDRRVEKLSITGLEDTGPQPPRCSIVASFRPYWFLTTLMIFVLVSIFMLIGLALVEVASAFGFFDTLCQILGTRDPGMFFVSSDFLGTTFAISLFLFLGRDLAECLRKRPPYSEVTFYRCMESG